MELSSLYFTFSAETQSFTYFHYCFFIPTNLKEKVVDSLKSHFNKLKESVEKIVLRDDTVVSETGETTHSKFEWGFKYQQPYNPGLDYLTLEYDVEMSGVKVTKAGLAIVHYSPNEEELLKVYDIIISLDGLTKNKNVGVEISKIAKLRQGKISLEDIIKA